MKTWGLSSEFDIVVLAIPLVVGCIVGLVTVSKKIPWSQTIAFAPVIGVAGVIVFGAIEDMFVGSHSDTNYILMLVQSTARALLFLPVIVVVGVPLSIVGYAVPYLLWLTMGRRTR